MNSKMGGGRLGADANVNYGYKKASAGIVSRLSVVQ